MNIDEQMSTVEKFLADTTLDNSRPFAMKEQKEQNEGLAEATKIKLIEPELLPDRPINFLELAELRMTVRQYSAENISAQELSYLLWCTQGVTAEFADGRTKRTVPSAGSCHPLDTFVYIRRAEGIAPGLYKFIPKEHALTPALKGEEGEENFVAGFKATNMVKNSALTFVWAANMNQSAPKFGVRAYRYAFLDAGHVCQNLYMAAQTIGVGVCAVGAFYDEKLNGILGLDSAERFAIYAATVGKLP